MDINNLNSFLKFGYFLDYQYPNYKINFSNLDKSTYEDASEEELIQEGSRLWHKAIEKQFLFNEKHVIPLSGGLDSRAILGSLLEFTDASNIHTYTYGSPTTLDYEIGNLIAKKIGTKHINFSLAEYEYNLDDLIDISNRVDNQTLLFLHGPVQRINELFSDFNVWSGILIDVYFGRHTHLQKADNLEDGTKNFFRENVYVKSINLTNVDDKMFFQYINYDDSTINILHYEHVLDILNRQLKFIAPHVLIKGHNYKTLLDRNLTDFSLNIDNKYLDNQYLYKKILLKSFPYLFSLPTKNNFGTSLVESNKNIFRSFSNRVVAKINNRFNKNFIHPSVNYIDFQKGIIERKDLNKIVYENIMDLKSRHFVDWIDIEKIWNDHINKRNNHSDALITLASLEIHLKAGKKL